MFPFKILTMFALRVRLHDSEELQPENNGTTGMNLSQLLPMLLPCNHCDTEIEVHDIESNFSSLNWKWNILDKMMKDC